MYIYHHLLYSTYSFILLLCSTLVLPLLLHTHHRLFWDIPPATTPFHFGLLPYPLTTLILLTMPPLGPAALVLHCHTIPLHLFYCVPPLPATLHTPAILFFFTHLLHVYLPPGTFYTHSSFFWFIRLFLIFSHSYYHHHTSLFGLYTFSWDFPGHAHTHASAHTHHLHCLPAFSGSHPSVHYLLLTYLGTLSPAYPLPPTCCTCHAHYYLLPHLQCSLPISIHTLPYTAMRSWSGFSHDRFFPVLRPTTHRTWVLPHCVLLLRVLVYYLPVDEPTLAFCVYPNCTYTPPCIFLFTHTTMHVLHTAGSLPPFAWMPFCVCSPHTPTILHPVFISVSGHEAVLCIPGAQFYFAYSGDHYATTLLFTTTTGLYTGVPTVAYIPSSTTTWTY